MSLLKDRPSTLVVGTGLAGMTAAFHLAEWGAHVALADRAPYLGGTFLLLDHTFTTNSCGLCIALPRQPSYCPTLASEIHARAGRGARLITPLPRTTLSALDGDPGAFVATLSHSPRYIDPDRCDNCGLCAAVCPVPRPCSQWGRPLHKDPQQKAIYAPPLRAVPHAYALDPDLCTRCGACVDACPRGAIDLEAASTKDQIEIDAVILSPGAAPFDAARAVEYGWGRCANVVTSLEFERLLNRSGPTGGRPLRPSDRQLPRGQRAPARIAFIQCVGSRSERLGRPYCSTSCCMITAKQISLCNQVAPQTEVTVFTMDTRAAGKGYERYLQRAAALPGVTYRWGRPAAVHEVPPEQSLRLLTPDGEEMFDLVILAVGMGPSLEVSELAAAAGVTLDEHGFVRPGQDGPGSTSRPGVFSCGSALTPADVPETVTQAAAAAALAAKTLSPALAIFPPGPAGGTEGGRSLSQHKDAQRKERYVDFMDQPPRIGLFLCTCHGALAETLDLPALADASRRLSAVAHVELLAAACEGPGLSAIERAAAEHGLNRIVIAGCSPRLYASHFEALMERLLLPAHFLARANIREGAAWAHAGSPAATAAAQGSLRVAVASLRETAHNPSPRPNPPPLERGREKRNPQGVTVLLPSGSDPCALSSGPGHAAGTSDRFGRQGRRRVLILGGGLAGMVAALTMADLGIDCDLIERTAHLGGHLRNLVQAGARDISRAGTLSPTLDAQALLAETVTHVQEAQGIHVWTDAELVDWSGVRGDFEAEIQIGDRQEHKVRPEHYDALIVATGAEPATTSEYLYGKHERVVTQTELASRIAELRPADLQSVVMIQCVGSRDENHPYCSRVCCTRAIANALALKEDDPEIEVSILFRDIRTPGMHELAYQQARRQGVRFFRYKPPDKPLVQANGDRLKLTVHDTLYDSRMKHPARITLDADLLVLSTGIAPREADNQRLASMLGVPLDEDRFFAEAHPKLRPTDFTRPGIYLCGMAYGPRTIKESISQARAAALRAALNVACPAEPRHDVATVVQKLCSSCELCVTHCPYGARVMTEGARGTHRQVASVLDHLCQGCGVCVAVCPNGASRQPALEPLQVLAMVDAALEESV